MRTGICLTFASALMGATLFAGSTWAQQAPMAGAQMQHGHTMGQAASPTLPGQDAFGAIQEIMRMLESDPATDWSKVNLERLRQHLIDMNEVTLRSEVKSTVVPGGSPWM